MNEVTLPPSPNWYRSRILACAKDGTVAYGAKNMIVITKLEKSTEIPTYSIISDAHSIKINALAFSPKFSELGKNLLVSAGDEHTLRVWDLDTMTAVLSHSFTDAKQIIIDVDWSRSDTTLICSVSSDGILVAWHTNHLGSKTMTIGKITATCIACCPHNSNTVAVGTKSGLVLIVNLQGAGSVTYRLRGHNAEVVSLSWCPGDTNVLSQAGGNDALLASGAKDNNVCIWRTSDGRIETQLTVPTSPLDTLQHRNKSPLHTVVHWLAPQYLLVSSPHCELISVDLQPSVKKPKWKFVHGCHSRAISAIAHEPYSAQDENWRADSCLRTWTTAQDRQLVCSTINLKTNASKVEYSVGTQGGFVYCIAASPLDTSRIAFGCGDRELRLLNLSEPHKMSFYIQKLWQKILGRITAIAWHPTSENLLAYGTDEGRIGVFDTNIPTKDPVLYHQHHRSTVYSLGWAPADKGFSLFSCGENEFIVYSPDKPGKPRIIIKKDCTEFAWNPDFRCVAVGFEDGTVKFMNWALEPCAQAITLLKKPVHCLRWHPESTATDLGLSPMRNYLAVANAATITVFDLSNFVNSWEKKDSNDSTEENPTSYRVIGTLNGHIDRVLDLAWSPHISGQLVSAGLDGVAQVWSVETQELLGTFVGHTDGVFSCMWSPMDADYIITGSADFCVRIWRLSDQKVVFPTEKAKPPKTKSKKYKNKKKSSTTTAVTEPSEGVTTPQESNGISRESSEAALASPAPEAARKTSNKKKGLLSTYNCTMNNKSSMFSTILRLAKESQGKNNTEEVSQPENKIFSIYGSKDEVLKLINVEQTALTAQGQHTATCETSMWNNSLQQQLQNAKSEGRLNDFLVSLAPSVSVTTWKEMCEAFANQLIREGNPTKAMTYLLAIHKIHRAVDVLVEFRMFKEAYVLAKCRLDPEDPVLTSVLEQLAKVSASGCQLEDAALCSIAKGDLSKAAKLLARRSDPLALEIAAEIAALIGDDETIETAVNRSINAELKYGSLAKARNLIAKFPTITYRIADLEALSELQSHREIVYKTQILSWLDEEDGSSILNNLKSKFKELDSAWCYKKLILITYPVNPSDEATLWLMVSQQIALAATSTDEYREIRHLVTALQLISSYEFTLPAIGDQPKPNHLIHVLPFLMPMKPLLEVERSDKFGLIAKSYRLFVCLALLNWAIVEIDKKSEIPIDLVIKVVEKVFKADVNREAVNFWVITNEISKLEANLASKGDDNETRSAEECQKLIERRAKLLEEKKTFIEERVCIPSPVLLYSRAILLGGMLTDKQDFSTVIGDVWKRAMASV